MTRLREWTRRAWHRPLLALACLAGLVLVACGGGVEGQGTGSFGYSQGTITGFGSIIVNDIHFDESSAQVLSEDGSSTLQASDLKLGMSVEIDSGPIDAVAGTAVARSVRLHSELRGPIAASDAGAGTLSVLGQTVLITSSTVFDAQLPGGQAALALGQVVQVHGFYDPQADVYTARRIEPAAGAGSYLLRGEISQLDTMMHSFHIGNASFAYTGNPAGLANGKLMRVQVQTTPDGQGRWVLMQLAQAARQPGNGAATRLSGVVSAFSSPARFEVDGFGVDGSAAALNPAGATLALGAWVRVEGTVQGGVLVAGRIDVKAADMGHPGQGGGGMEFQVRGQLSLLDPLAKTFSLRGVTVSYAGPVNYNSGSELNLVLNAMVEVKGQLSPDGTRLVASSIKFL